MKSLFRYTIVFALPIFLTSRVHSQTGNWSEISGGFSQNLNCAIPYGSYLLAAGEQGRFVFFSTQTGQMVSGQISDTEAFLSAKNLRFGSNGSRPCILASGNKIFRPDSVSGTLISDSLPEMPLQETVALRLVDLNSSGVDLLRYGFALDSGRILACKIPYTNTRFDIQMPFSGRINDLASFASWGVIVVGDSGKIWRTTGLDQNFQAVSQLHHTKRINSLIPKGNSKFWAAGNEGSLLYSTNAGSSWDMLDFPLSDDILGGLYIDSSLFVFTATGKIFCSKDEGQSWLQEPILTLGAVREMVKAQDGKLYCVGDNGKIFRRDSIQTSVNHAVSAQVPVIRISAGCVYFENPESKPAQFLLTDASGRMIESGKIDARSGFSCSVPPGRMFFARLLAAEGQVFTSRVLVSR